MNEAAARNINEYAKGVQASGFGTAESNTDYNALVILLLPTARAKVDYFYKAHCGSHRIDKDQLLSLALYEGVKYTIKKWDIDKCDYHKRYAYYLPSLFKTHFRNEVDAEVRAGMASAVGLDTPVGIDITLADTLAADIPEEDVYILYKRVATMLRDFGVKHGEDKAAVMGIMLVNADSLDARTRAVVEYYGTDTYNSTIRKRVERIKKMFQDFYTLNIENYM